MNNDIRILSVTGTIRCICGETEFFRGSPQGWKEMCAAFSDRHSGQGHRLCDKREQQRIKAQKRRETAKAKKEGELYSTLPLWRPNTPNA